MKLTVASEFKMKLSYAKVPCPFVSYCPSINVILTIISDIFLVRFLKILVLLKQL